MGLFYALRGFFRTPGAPPRDQGVQSGLPATSEATAAPVTFDSAMQISAVWAAVRITSETIGSLPFTLSRKTPQGDVPATDHPLHHILMVAPNRYQTPVEFWESMALNLCVSGNAYAVITRVGGQVTSLMPLSSSQVTTCLLNDGTVVHEYINGSDVRIYSQESMLHIKLFGNGIVGMSPLSYAAQSIGIAVAADRRVGKIYSNGAKPSGVLTIDRTLTPEQRQMIRTNYQGLQSGNDDRLFVLEAGMQYHQVSMSPQDIQLLDSRRFQIEDIGRFFGVPSILLNQTFGQSSLGSNVYEIFQGFYKLNLRPYLEKIEASVLRWLLSAEESGKYTAEFDFDALLRADRESRMRANREAIYSGQLTPNEARADEGRLPMEGGDKLMIQGATVPITSMEVPDASQIPTT